MGSTIKTINPLRRFQKGAILVHILHHAAKKSFYGLWLKEELAKHDYSISDGTLYPWLKRLTYSGFLYLEKRNVEGKIRKYYSLTKKGKELFDEIKKLLMELYKEVVLEETI